MIMNTTTKKAGSKVKAENRYPKIYKDAVRNNFSFLKQTIKVEDLFAKSIPLTLEGGALVPLCELHAADKALLEKLVHWRKAYASLYSTKVPATAAGVKKWCMDLYKAKDSILFLIVDLSGNAIGHIGITGAINNNGEMEIENAVLGSNGLQSGILSNAVKALIKWALEIVFPQIISVKVAGSDTRAIDFYKKLSFAKDGKKTGKTPLRMVYAPAKIKKAKEIILTAGPSISAREMSYTQDAARYGWNHQMDKYLKRLEAQFAEYVGTKYAIPTSCCTGALHLAVAACGIGPGDEVIVPETTWVATANSAIYNGATPIFADIQSDSWCMDPDSFESLITKRTKAVMPVHLYGHPAEMDRIMAIARKHHLHVIEDAAPAIGTEFKGQKTGSFGDFAAFSFQGAKMLVSGEGGMLVTSNDELYKKVYSLWDQGRTPGTFWINEVGWKYKMSNLSAALVLGQLERSDEMIEKKRTIFSWYAEGLKGVPHIKLNYETPWARSICWMSSIFLDPKAGITRDGLREALKKLNVDTRPVFPAISQYPMWPRKQEMKPVAKLVGEQSINLPSGVCLKHEQVDYICDCMRKILGKL